MNKTKLKACLLRYFPYCYGLTLREMLDTIHQDYQIRYKLGDARLTNDYLILGLCGIDLRTLNRSTRKMVREVFSDWKDPYDSWTRFMRINEFTYA